MNIFRQNRLLIITISLVVSLFLFYRIYTIFCELEKEKHKNELEAFENSLFLLRERSYPMNLAQDIFWQATNKISHPSNADAKRIFYKLKCAFDNSWIGFLTNSSGTFLFRKNLPKEEAFEIDRFICEIPKTLGKFPWYRRADSYPNPSTLGWVGKIYIKYFGQSFAFTSHERCKDLNVIPVTFKSERGICLIGNFHKGGRIFAFVGKKNLTPKWVQKVLKKNIAKLPFIEGRLLKINHLPNDLFLSDKFKELFFSKWRKAKLGAVLDKNEFIGFFRLPLDNTRIWVTHKPYKKITHGGFWLWLFSWFVITTILLSQIIESIVKPTWESKLIEKFAFLMLISSLFPIFALSWLSFFRDEWHRNLQQTEIFNQLENELESLEKKSEILISNVSQLLRSFCEPSKWLSLDANSEHIISEWYYKARKQWALRFLIVIFKDISKKCFIGYSGPEPKRAEMSLAIILSILKKIGLEFSPSQFKDHKSIEKHTVFLDMLADLVSRDEFTSFVEKQEMLISAESTADQTLNFFQIFRKKSDEKTIVFYIAIDRNQLETETAPRWLEQLDGEYLPRKMLITKSLLFPEFIPPNAEAKITEVPLLKLVLTKISYSGGIQRLSIPVFGKKYSVLVRPIKGTNFIGMATCNENDVSTRQDNKKLVMIAVLFPGIIGITGIILFNTYFIRPIRTLNRVVTKMAQGDYDSRVQVMTDDEIGTLCLSFNKMAESLKEKEFLGRFISDLTMELVKTGTTENLIKGTRTNAAVLFSDIRGFTSIAETLPPEDVVNMLNSYFTEVEKAIENYNGIIDKFIGDAIMAVFMPSHGKTDPAIRAVEAGLEMLEILKEYNFKRLQSNMFQIEIGVGIATGEVLLGILGSDSGTKRFTVIGPTVNKASSMEKLTKKAKYTKIVICPETANRLKGKFKLCNLNVPDNKNISFEVITKQ